MKSLSRHLRIKSIMEVALLPLIVLTCFTAAFRINSRVKYPVINIPMQEAAFNLKAESISLLSLGHKRLISDIIWIQTLLDSDLDHYKKKDLNSWLYLRFKTISQLDPLFYQNYYYGGQYLMIVKDDLIGSEDLLRRGLFHYDLDIGLNWQLGFLFAIELRDPARAMPFLDKIRFNPNRPKMFDSLYTKLSANALGPEEAFEYALTVWKTHKDGDPIKQRLFHLLYALRAEIDTACLTKNQTGCNVLDFEGNPYQKKGGVWTPPRKTVNLKLPKN